LKLQLCSRKNAFAPFSKTVHQHTPPTRWMSFWIARHLTLCFHVAKCWHDEHFHQ